MKKLNLDTNSPNGTYRYGDPHPTVDGRFFGCMRNINGSTRELWLTANSLQSKKRYEKTFLKARKIPKIKRETLAKYGAWKGNDKHPYLPNLVFQGYLKGVEAWESPAQRERRLAAGKAYRENHKEEEAKRKKEHRMKNAADYVARARARKSKIAVSFGNLSKGEKRSVNALYQFRDILNGVQKEAVFVVDHIDPLAKGGKHHPDNLQLATWSYNAWKSVKVNVTPHDFFPA